MKYPPNAIQTAVYIADGYLPPALLTWLICLWTHTAMVPGSETLCSEAEAGGKAFLYLPLLSGGDRA